MSRTRGEREREREEEKRERVVVEKSRRGGGGRALFINDVADRGAVSRSSSGRRFGTHFGIVDGQSTRRRDARICERAPLSARAAATRINVLAYTGRGMARRCNNSVTRVAELSITSRGARRVTLARLVSSNANVDRRRHDAYSINRQVPMLPARQRVSALVSYESRVLLCRR